MNMTFRTLDESAPGAAWKAVFATGWPGWKSWLTTRETPDAPDLATSKAALSDHMPEFLPVWEALVKSAGADDTAARFLTFWSPPRYLGQCANAVSDGPNPVLVRNYDLDPRLNEATLLKTNWLRPVIGMVEGLAGLADGINGDGLAISLTYGGRKAVGPGFGIPLVVRYVLETCADVPEAITTLKRLPHHMSYNLTAVDRAGRHATILIAPDREVIVSDARYVTNHQIAVEDEKHGTFCNTLGRSEHLRNITEAGTDRDDLLAAFQETPLYNTQFEAGFGTVYTALYDPAKGEAVLVWPGQPEWAHSFDDFREETRAVTYGTAASEQDEPDWIRFVPPEARRWITLGMENVA